MILSTRNSKDADASCDHVKMEMDKDPEVAKLSVYSSAGEFKGEPDQLFINVDIVLCV